MGRRRDEDVTGPPFIRSRRGAKAPDCDRRHCSCGYNALSSKVNRFDPLADTSGGEVGYVGLALRFALWNGRQPDADGGNLTIDFDGQPGGQMMITPNSLFVAAFACAAFCATAAEAQLGSPGPALGWPTDGRPATEKDLAGKKICWDNGRSGMFGANGQFTNEGGRHTIWLVTEPGVVKVGNWYTQYLILPDGSFYNHWYSGHQSITGHKEHWGKVCN